jgi:DNA-binding winged helix-turn-helix (wHTH) protein/TolB-like protein
MSDQQASLYEFEGYRFDPANLELYKDGKPIALTRKCLELLAFLVTNHGRTLGKEELLSKVWADTFVEDSTLTSHIYMLRKALETGGKEPLIKTVPKKGYTFSAAVREVSPEMLEAAIPESDYAKPSAPRSAAASFGSFFNGRASFIILAAGCLLAALMIGVLAAKTRSQHNIRSIAVLPFQQINLEKEDKMGLGMADILINQIGRDNSLRVTPTAAISKYANAESVDPYAVGEELEVDAVLTASSQCENGVARVTYQLYDVRSGDVVFSEMLEENHDGIFPLQDRITSRIYDRLAGELRAEREGPVKERN